jgi:hypothetical protein
MPSSVHRFLISTGFALGMFVNPSPCKALSAKEVYAKTAAEIVTIECWNSSYIKTKQGSGIILGQLRNKSELRDKSATDILTNWHVISDAREIRVTDKQGNKSTAAILYFDESKDIALLKAFVKAAIAEPEIAKDISVGDNVYALGTPKGLGWTISNGIVSGIRERGGLDVVQTTAPISPGSSGGGLFNDAGELIGMTSFNLKDAQNLNFALRITQTFLDSLTHFRQSDSWFTSFFNEEFWSAGYYEPGENLENPSHDKVKLWSSYTKRISQMQSEYSLAFAKMTPQEQSDMADEMLRTKDGTKGTVRAPCNVIDLKIRRTLVERYNNFPHDLEGLFESLRFVDDKEVELHKLAEASEEWPGEFEIVSYRCGMLLEDDQMPLKTIVDPISRFIERLPSMAELKQLIERSDVRAGAIARLGIVAGKISAKLNLIDGFRGKNKETASARSALAHKGW